MQTAKLSSKKLKGKFLKSYMRHFGDSAHLSDSLEVKKSPVSCWRSYSFLSLFLLSEEGKCCLRLLGIITSSSPSSSGLGPVGETKPVSFCGLSPWELDCHFDSCRHWPISPTWSTTLHPTADHPNLYSFVNDFIAFFYCSCVSVVSSLLFNLQLSLTYLPHWLFTPSFWLLLSSCLLLSLYYFSFPPHLLQLN